MSRCASPSPSSSQPESQVGTSLPCLPVINPVFSPLQRPRRLSTGSGCATPTQLLVPMRRHSITTMAPQPQSTNITAPSPSAPQRRLRRYSLTLLAPIEDITAAGASSPARSPSPLPAAQPEPQLNLQSPTHTQSPSISSSPCSTSFRRSISPSPLNPLSPDGSCSTSLVPSRRSTLTKALPSITPTTATTTPAPVQVQAPALAPVTSQRRRGSFTFESRPQSLDAEVQPGSRSGSSSGERSYSPTHSKSSLPAPESHSTSRECSTASSLSCSPLPAIRSLAAHATTGSSIETSINSFSSSHPPPSAPQSAWNDPTPQDTFTREIPPTPSSASAKRRMRSMSVDMGSNPSSARQLHTFVEGLSKQQADSDDTDAHVDSANHSSTASPQLSRRYRSNLLQAGSPSQKAFRVLGTTWEQHARIKALRVLGESDAQVDSDSSASHASRTLSPSFSVACISKSPSLNPCSSPSSSSADPAFTSFVLDSQGQPKTTTKSNSLSPLPAPRRRLEDDREKAYKVLGLGSGLPKSANLHRRRNSMIETHKAYKVLGCSWEQHGRVKAVHVLGVSELQLASETDMEIKPLSDDTGVVDNNKEQSHPTNTAPTTKFDAQSRAVVRSTSPTPELESVDTHTATHLTSIDSHRSLPGSASASACPSRSRSRSISRTCSRSPSISRSPSPSVDRKLGLSRPVSMYTNQPSPSEIKHVD